MRIAGHSILRLVSLLRALRISTSSMRSFSSPPRKTENRIASASFNNSRPFQSTRKGPGGMRGCGFDSPQLNAGLASTRRNGSALVPAVSVRYSATRPASVALDEVSACDRTPLALLTSASPTEIAGCWANASPTSLIEANPKAHDKRPGDNRIRHVLMPVSVGDYGMER